MLTPTVRFQSLIQTERLSLPLIIIKSNRRDNPETPSKTASFSVLYPFCRKYFAAKPANDKRLIYQQPTTALNQHKQKLLPQKRKCNQTFTILTCHKCKKYLISKTCQKTRQCPTCQTRIKLIKAKKVAHLKTAREASDYIRALKRRTAEST